MKYITYATFQEAEAELNHFLMMREDIDLDALAGNVIAQDEEGRFFVVEELLSDSIERLKG